nr:ImmA/IrrE family metallo-endopeptidase [Brevibacterium yomogidense]
MLERGVTVYEWELEYANAVTDVEAAVWVDPRLLQRERRATLAHELEHFHIHEEAPGRLGPGVESWFKPSVEAECNERAAVKLISFEALVDACKWADSIEEAAEELHVNDEMVRARLRTLTKAETRTFDYQVGRGYAARLRGRPLERRTPLRRKA